MCPRGAGLNSSNRADTVGSHMADIVRSQTSQSGSAPHPDGEHLDGAGCQVDRFVKFLAREWMSHILWQLARNGTMRFGALRRALPGAVSARTLSRRLKELESYGLVSRHDAGTLPLQVEYRLTKDGRRLDAALRRGERLSARLKKRPP
jgi:DNA-binding HxlR family transcriptional regulator